jgi:DNA modification methylase
MTGYDDGTVRILTGDCRDVLPTLPGDSVQCVVTSPPYWGLRDYGVAGQIGLEPTPELYVAHLVEIFRAVRRVLREDGTVWLVLGDSYNSSSQNNHGKGGYLEHAHLAPKDGWAGHRPNAPGLKSKDLVGIPWRVAFALQADGWYLRADIIWAKPNPMPESVTDRPTKAHEYVFLLSKQERYFYDAEAIKEPWAESSIAGHAGRRTTRPFDQGTYAAGAGRHEVAGHGLVNGPGRFEKASGRNRRSVWTIATEPYPEAHFATFPTDLVAPCILAGTSARGCCAACGAPFARVVEQVGEHQAHWAPRRQDKQAEIAAGRVSGGGVMETGYIKDYQTSGWRPPCACDAAVIPCTVLDPFAGSGTTLYVAKEYGRRAIGIDLNAAYGALAEDRLRQGVLALAP